MKVGLHQGSLLSPLLFAVVMDVVFSEARSGLLSELLYADDIVLMTPSTMEQLGRSLSEWRTSLIGKGLKVHAGKWPRVVCGKGVQANSVHVQYVKIGFTNGGDYCCW